ncbi:unnamed protein product [Euphydryas editha]|uniref:DNA-directed RNA polymerase n=1 Tax=Euphydryas editha TaxID=104508 RepID=A0AAU9UR13_EUPED|nr:unnamed protein product [Euphydryas editha]
MEYVLKKIKLREIEAAGIKTFSSEEMLNLLKLWWVNLDQSKSLIRKFPFLNGVLYVKTVHAYVYPNTLTRPRTPEEIYDERGKSVIQRNILAPKVKRGLRAQILCDFHIDADVMVIPEAFAREFRIYSYKILNPTTLYSNVELTTIPDEYLHRLPENLTVLIKRDPCIHPASISTISKVAVTDRDNLYVSPLTMGHKNADIDGDVYGIYIFESRYSAEEVRVFLNCKSNMSLTDESTRLCFSQMHIFYMQGNGHLLSEPFKSIYKNHKEMIEGNLKKSLRVSKHLLANHFDAVSNEW